jgi:succinate dehydrogenase/fumarate reductase cytochrome b subunit
MVSTKKLKAEAALSKTKTILGWFWNFRQLIIYLPYNKFVAWTKSVQDTISAGYANSKEFESTIGRLNHLFLVIPFVYHFLSRLRELLWKAQRST